MLIKRNSDKMRVSVVALLCFTGKTVQSFAPLQSPAFSRSFSSTTKTKGTQLYYVQTDETLEERLREVKQSWEGIKSSGLKKFFVDEIIAAEKSVVKGVSAAEKATEVAIAAKFQEVTANKGIVDTIKAAEIVADAAATSAKADASGVNDLNSASIDVVQSIKNSETAVQSIIDKIAKDALVETSDVKILETNASDVKKSMDAAQSIAANVEKISAQDASSIKELESVGAGLVTKIESVEKLAEDAVKNIAADPNVVTSLENVAKDVVEEMKAAEEVATAVAQVAQADAKAVSSLQIETNDVIDAITSVESAIKQNAANLTSESKENLKSAATVAFEKIKIDEKNAEAVAEVVKNDAQKDLIAVEALGKADREIDEIVKAAEKIVNENGSVSASELSDLGKKTEAVTASVKTVEKAASECTDCAIKAVEKAMASSEAILNEIPAKTEAAIEKVANPVVEVSSPPIQEAVKEVVKDASPIFEENIKGTTPLMKEIANEIIPIPGDVTKETPSAVSTAFQAVNPAVEPDVSLPPIKESIEHFLKEVATSAPIEESLQEVAKETTSNMNSLLEGVKPSVETIVSSATVHVATEDAYNQVVPTLELSFVTLPTDILIAANFHVEAFQPAIQDTAAIDVIHSSIEPVLAAIAATSFLL